MHERENVPVLNQNRLEQSCTQKRSNCTESLVPVKCHPNLVFLLFLNPARQTLPFAAARRLSHVRTAPADKTKFS